MRAASTRHDVKRRIREMADANSAPDFRPLENDYRIVGELHNAKSARRFVGTRIGDGAAVMISVVAPPVTADNNELSHFAADAKLLASLRHPSLLSVLDGRWLGDRFAVVTERTSGTTLQDELDRGAELRNPRIAMVLQNIWSGLEAARELGVVHRWVTPDSVYFEPNTKGVKVALLPTPIPVTGVPGAAADARTIGTLAWAMLTGTLFDAARPDAKLIDLAPNLAGRVVDAVEQMVHYRDRDPAPDVPTALGIIAAGDVLKQGEIEIQAMKEEYDERHRAELEKCENHRMEVEQYAAEQASLITDERATLERLATEQTAALAAERVEFDKLMKARENRIVGLRVDLERQAARAARGLDVEGFAAMDKGPPTKQSSRALVPTAIGGVVLALIAAGVIMYERSPRAPASGRISVGGTTVVPTLPSVDTSRLKRGGFLSQSVGGNVGPSRSGPPLATSRDSSAAIVSSDSAAADSAARRAVANSGSGETIPQRPRSRPRPSEPANDVNGMIPRSSPVESMPQRPTDTLRRDTAARADTSYIRDSTIPRDTAMRRDPIVPRPNFRVETTYVRGTVRRDSVAGRPDSVRRP